MEYTPLLRSVPAACNELGCSEWVIYRAIAAGTLDARKIGRRTLITQASIESYISGLPKAEARPDAYLSQKKRARFTGGASEHG